MTVHTAGFRIREIEPRDDPRVAALVRDTLAEFDCTGPGFALHDAEVDAMAAAYAGEDRAFYVVELEGEVHGCGGFGPLAGAGPEVAEVRKMYFDPALRGRGAGRALLTRILDGMRRAGYRRAYLETTSKMESARRLYERLGFVEIDAPWGRTGHGGCDRFYALELGGTGSGRA
jgi:putative acetyltransferase